MEDLETELNSVKETAKDADPGKITAREDRLNQLNNNVNETKIRIEEANKQLKGVVSRLEALEKEHAGRSKELAELEKYRKESSVIENVATCLKGFQKHLAEEIRPALEEIGSEMLASISAGKHVAMHIDNNYEIMVEDNKGNMQRAAILSGGEQIRANICLRLALTRLVSQRTGIPVGFLIFDEPLPSQDPGHIERIMQLLDSLRGFYQQQFIISHVGDLQSADEINYIVEFDSNTTPQLVNA
jgi:exonuclease SbcC